MDERGVGRGHDIAVAISTSGVIGLAIGPGEGSWWQSTSPAEVVAALERRLSPRWIWWDRGTAQQLAADDVEVVRCWDVLAVDRMLTGRWRTTPAEAWAHAHDLPPPPQRRGSGQLDLLTAATPGDPHQPIDADGQLNAEWEAGAWEAQPERVAQWTMTALRAADRQRLRVDALPDGRRARSTAHAESAAELLCAELAATGLPIDVAAAERIIGEAIGPRPRDDSHAAELRSLRDAAVTGLLGPNAPSVDLRSPADVKAMLRRVGLDLPDTRAWRLERHRGAHPIVAELLAWRKAERIATTFGYRWLDTHVRAGRLHGEWSASDGAAGRMTASAGLHNLPAELRPAVAAERGHLLVRADLGQIEPRVLAAVSGDRALIAATADDDMYRPVAERLGVDRDAAKVAVLGAMYGATTGTSAHALRGLNDSYPTAMAMLERAADDGREGRDVFTIGGRRVRMWAHDDHDEAGVGDIDRARSAAAARGRYARNAVIQGAAAELFKVWAVIVRQRVRPLAARIVLCLHDELLVHGPADQATAIGGALSEALDEAAFRWSPTPDVRFVAAIDVVARWSDAT